MKSSKDDLTDRSGELEGDSMTDTEEFSSAVEQPLSGIHKEWNGVSELPADYIRREDMEIKDVAKKHIVPFLPAKSLMKFRAVSKEWNDWIVSPLLSYQQCTSFQKLSGYFYQSVDVDFQSDPNFLSLDRSAIGVPSPSLDFLPEKVKVLSSSSGLLLCEGLEGNMFVIL
ncbi:hypothetical protein HAX54_042491 [Datura stramonium]|uniref:F-box domain-containing protein n=1 Tax=Datura stramonium TaxID=4076 RepID=A0ABS8W198_DATST|nr:hypothetical protein [Datura stramonium]